MSSPALIARRISPLILSAFFVLLLPQSEASAARPALVLSRPTPSGTETVEFSMSELEALPQSTIVTSNEFTDGEATYRGPLVLDVLEHLGLERAKSLRFIAANDYYVDIPASDFRRYNAILAMEVDGKKLGRRDKGPLWLMYPISDHAELRGDPVYITRLIWQVVRIEAQ
ncbi:MAG: molybdopterin-dependent oxidoreductase [Rhodobacteraceae bacterium]|nr:molybdopterin-dependent oxidoreductase [Paracoccaceae bacterium]